MISLTEQEREKFAIYLDQCADQDKKMAEELEKLSHGPIAKKYRTEAMAQKIVAGILRSWETQIVKGGRK